MVVERILLKTDQSPGDVVMLTAALRDLHLAYPGRYQTDVRTSADDLFLHNPYVTRLSASDCGVRTITDHYPAIHKSNQRPYHFIHGYIQDLEEQLGIRIPATQFRGDIYLAEHEKVLPAHLAALGIDGPFWVLVAGGKFDFTAKWVNPSVWGALVKHFENRITFVQCGEAGHWHPPIPGAVNAIGRTSIRDFVRLIYHAQGVACGVTLAMHLAAAVPTAPGSNPLRACVVVAGGREPTHWEAYTGHQYLSRVGMLSCCAAGGCWKSRCQLVGDGDPKDQNDVCERPIQVTPELRIAECIHSITAVDVIRAIECYYEGGMLKYRKGSGREAVGAVAEFARIQVPGPDAIGVPRSGIRENSDAAGVPIAEFARTQAVGADATGVPCSGIRENSDGAGAPVAEFARTQAVGADDKPRTLASPATDTQSLPPRTLASPATNPQSPPVPVLIIFPHGLGDAVQLTSLLLHLKHYHPEWVIDVVAGIGKHTAFSGLCRRVFILDREHVDRSAYAHVFELGWHECHRSFANHPATKAEQCLLDVFGLAPVPELCRYEINVSPAVRAAAERYFESICPMGPCDDGRWPVVVIHYEGNSSADEKNLPHELIERVCEAVCAAEAVPVILDWDRRTPLADGVRIHNPGVDHPLWSATGTGDAETIAALIASASLCVGVDSGPAHVAGATGTPTIAVWTRHSPLHYFGHAPNVLHLVPEGHGAMLRGDRAVGAVYFAKHYQHATYSDLSAALLREVHARLPRLPEGLVFSRGFWIRQDNAQQDLVVVRDVAENDCYRMAEMRLPGPTFVDAGAHIGTASTTFRERYPTARIFALECCPENIPVLNRNVGRFATVVQAALSYEPEVALLNAVYPECVSTGGSTVISRGELARRLAAGADVPCSGIRENSDGAGAPLAEFARTQAAGADAIGDPGSGIRENSDGSAPVAEFARTQATDVEVNAVPSVPPTAELGAPPALSLAPVSLPNWPKGSAEQVGNEPGTNHHSPLTTDDSPCAPRLGEYWADTRPLRTITLEGLMAEQGLDWIDVLKLDCEGCELDLLDQCQVLDRVGLIVGEFHGRERFLALVTERLPDWKLEILRDGEPGTFWLTNPASAERGARNAEHDLLPADSNIQSEVLNPQSHSLFIQGRKVEFTAHHALRFSAAPDGSLVPVLCFRGREVTQPWSLELAGSGIRTNSDANGAVRPRAHDTPAPSPIQNPKSEIQNRTPAGTWAPRTACASARAAAATFASRHSPAPIPRTSRRHWRSAESARTTRLTTHHSPLTNCNHETHGRMSAELGTRSAEQKTQGSADLGSDSHPNAYCPTPYA